MPKVLASLPVVLVAVLGLFALAGCSSGTEADADESAAKRQQRAPSTSERTRQAPREPRLQPVAFSGNFSTVDTRQRCKAGARVVVCASTVSGQRVTLDGAGARYEGEVATSFPAAAPLGVGNEITTASGIRCLNSSRGIECTRGGHGFVIGDSAVVILKGPNEERFGATAPEPESEVPASPEPDKDLTAGGTSTYRPTSARTASWWTATGGTRPRTGFRRARSSTVEDRPVGARPSSGGWRLNSRRRRPCPIATTRSWRALT